MANPIPFRLTRDRFRNSAEYQVYEAVCDQLTDDWWVVASLDLRASAEGGERELDLVLLHATDGIVIIEVKGFAFEVRGGKFFAPHDQTGQWDPLAQIEAQRSYLSSVLEPILEKKVFGTIAWGLATPKLITIDGALPQHMDRAQLITGEDLGDLLSVVDRLCCIPSHNVPLGPDRLRAVLEVLCPDADFDFSERGLRDLVRRRMEQRLITETKVLESLELNARVIVTGGAGSGKTRLAVAWTRNASFAAKTTLLTCYNDPLALSLASDLEGLEGVTVSAFLRLCQEIVDSEEPDDPAARDRYWNADLPSATRLFLTTPLPRYDTIVVDEVQDFPKLWFDILERLLVPGGQILCVGDPAQDLRTVSSVLEDATGWTRALLSTNNRNSPPIAQLLRRRLGGAAAPKGDPFASPVQFVTVMDPDDTTNAVRRAIANLREADEELWVLTISAAARDRLRRDLSLSPFEERDRGVVCETIYRVKGLDASSIIFVADTETDGETRRRLLYSGISRARDELVIIGAPTIAEVLGFAHDAAES